MFSIGKFSKIAGLTVKTLHFYHEKGLLVPSYIDSCTGYRYYDDGDIEKAKTISCLRNLEFSVKEIQAILGDCEDQKDMIFILEKHRKTITEKIEKYQNIKFSIDSIITSERRAELMNKSSEIIEKDIDPILVAGIMMKGKYSDCGKSFSKLGKLLGRYICGKPMCLQYDQEYRENDAQFEPCMPIRQENTVEGVSIRTLEGGHCISLIHKGSYEQLGRSYQKILKYVKEKECEIVCPTREIYIKGPGMIFRGNPKNYLTEIQMLVK